MEKIENLIQKITKIIFCFVGKADLPSLQNKILFL